MQHGYASVSDEDLLAALRSDDDRAFAELYRRYARLLVTTAFRKTGDGAVAEDLVHELFLSLWLRRRELFVQGAVRVYLFSALKNRVISHYHRQANAALVPLDEFRESLPAPAEADALLGEFYEQSLRKLPERCRQVFVMSRSGYTMREIAQTLGISEKTVEVHIGKALRLLRAEFRDYAVGVLLLLGMRGLE